MKSRFAWMALLSLALLFLTSPALRAEMPAAQIGIVVMHGKGGSPGRFVNGLAEALERDGFLVANLEMPWSGRPNWPAPASTPQRLIQTGKPKVSPYSRASASLVSLVAP